MTAPAHHSIANHSAHDDGDARGGFALGELSPGERIGPPRARSGSHARLWKCFVVVILLGGAWAVLGHRADWPLWLATVTAAYPPANYRRAPLPTEPAAIEPSPLAAHAPNSEGRDASPAAALTATIETTASPPPAAAMTYEPLPQRSAATDPTDPYQRRAAAVGLHPDLSRVLLAQLSPTDYRNAGIAVQTAVAETPETEVFVWPRDRKPDLALFQVHFVPGAAPDCRRYVVTVTKDGWSTTALPMERCGSQPLRPRREK